MKKYRAHKTRELAMRSCRWLARGHQECSAPAAWFQCPCCQSVDFNSSSRWEFDIRAQLQCFCCSWTVLIFFDNQDAKIGSKEMIVISSLVWEKKIFCSIWSNTKAKQAIFLMPPVCSFWQFFFSVHFVWMESFVMCKLRRAEKRWFDDKMTSPLWGFVPFTRQVNSRSELGTKITWVIILFFPLPPLSPSSFSQSSHFAVASVITDNNKPRDGKACENLTVD